MRLMLTILLTAIVCAGSSPAPAQHRMAMPPQGAAEQQPTPEESMRRRFPHPVRVGDLIGLRVLDYNDVTIGVVRHVARTTEGKIQVIVAHTGPLGWGGRLVSVPIEAVAIFGRQLASLDMKPEEYASAATWTTATAELLGTKETILIGLTKR